MSSSSKNFSAAFCAALCALSFVAVNLKDPFGDKISIVFCVGAIISAASASFIFFPYLGRRVGLAGVFQDIGIVAVGVLVASVIAGSLILPGAGTILAPFIFCAAVIKSPLLGGIVVIGAASVMLLSRIKQHK